MRYSTDPSKLLYLVTAMDDTGRRAWYYVMVRPDALGSFKLKLATRNLTLTEYGTIVESGYGDEPLPATAVLQKYMQATAACMPELKSA